MSEQPKTPSPVRQVLASVLTSRKALATITGVLITLAAYPLTRWAGMEPEAAIALTTGVVPWVVGLLVAFVLGQGVADHGKEALLVKGRLAAEVVEEAKEDPTAAALRAKILGGEEKGTSA